MDIVGGLSAAAQAISIAKSLRDVEKGFDTATYRAQIADLINALTDAKLALSDAKDGIASLKQENSDLRKSFERKMTLADGIGGYRYPTGQNGQPVGYPVCPKCDEVDGRIIQLREHEYFSQAKCPACSQIYRPVECYLEAGTYRTKSEEYQARVNAAMTRGTDRDYY